MIQALSLNADNKIWLAEKLISEAQEESRQCVAEPPCQYGVEERKKRLCEAEARILQGDPGIDSEEIDKELFKEMPWLE